MPAVAELIILKKAPMLLLAGERGVWLLTVFNFGPSAATAVEIVDALPDAIALVAYSFSDPLGAMQCNVTGGMRPVRNV